MREFGEKKVMVNRMKGFWRCQGKQRLPKAFCLGPCTRSRCSKEVFVLSAALLRAESRLKREDKLK